MGDKTELVVKSAIYTTYGSVGRVDRWHREQSVARSGNVRTWATPDPGASEFVCCAIIGLIVHRMPGSATPTGVGEITKDDINAAENVRRQGVETLARAGDQPRHTAGAHRGQQAQ